jgi:hypothetical protein
LQAVVVAVLHLHKQVLLVLVELVAVEQVENQEIQLLAQQELVAVAVAQQATQVNQVLKAVAVVLYFSI